MRAGAALALLLLPVAVGCAPAAEPAPAARLPLDCALPYETLSARILATPDLIPAPQQRGEPYRFYNVPGGREAFVLTEPGAPGHPAVFKQEAVRENGRKVVKNTGCAYGDKAGFAEVMAYLQGLPGH